MGDRVVTELVTLSGAKPCCARDSNSVTRVADRPRQSEKLWSAFSDLLLSVTLSLPLRGRRCDRVAVTVGREARNMWSEKNWRCVWIVNH